MKSKNRDEWERRAKGIYAKHDKLFAAIQTYEIVDGKKKYIKKWISTDLADTPRNIKKAKDFREDLLLRDKEEFAADKKITMEEFVKHYLVIKKRLVADSTYASLMFRTNHISKYFQNICIGDITTRDVNAFLDHLLMGGNDAKHITKSPGLSKRSVRDIKAVLINIMNQALAEGIIHKNPALDATINAQLARKTAYKEEDTFFSYEECIRFLKGVKGHPLYLFFYFTVFFGLRRSEALGLKWSNINLELGRFTIASTVTKGTVIHREDVVKTSSSLRDYPLSPEQIKLLKELKERENEFRQILGSEYCENDYVFKHDDGSLYYPDYPSDAFRKLVRSMPDLPQNIHLHGLRSSCVSILVHEGFDIKQIQKWVGHADPETTLKIYSKVKSGQAKEEISTKMSSLIQLQ